MEGGIASQPSNFKVYILLSTVNHQKLKMNTERPQSAYDPNGNINWGVTGATGSTWSELLDAAGASQVAEPSDAITTPARNRRAWLLSRMGRTTLAAGVLLGAAGVGAYLADSDSSQSPNHAFAAPVDAQTAQASNNEDSVALVSEAIAQPAADQPGTQLSQPEETDQVTNQNSHQISLENLEIKTSALTAVEAFEALDNTDGKWDNRLEVKIKVEQGAGNTDTADWALGRAVDKLIENPHFFDATDLTQRGEQRWGLTTAAGIADRDLVHDGDTIVVEGENLMSLAKTVIASDSKLNQQTIASISKRNADRIATRSSVQSHAPEDMTVPTGAAQTLDRPEAQDSSPSRESKEIAGGLTIKSASFEGDRATVWAQEPNGSMRMLLVKDTSKEVLDRAIMLANEGKQARVESVNGAMLLSFLEAQDQIPPITVMDEDVDTGPYWPNRLVYGGIFLSAFGFVSSIALLPRQRIVAAIRSLLARDSSRATSNVVDLASVRRQRRGSRVA